MVVNDLRSALEVLRQMDGQLVETDIEVDPEAELAGVYRHVGAGGTVMRPTDRKSTRLNSSHNRESRMPSSA